jgi:hypothetical protein
MTNSRAESPNMPRQPTQVSTKTHRPAAWLATLFCAGALVLLASWNTALAQVSVTRTADLRADMRTLIALSPGQWAGLTMADIGEAWWIVHDAALAHPSEFGAHALAVNVGGKLGYIDTKRLDDPGTGKTTFILTDFFQSYPGGNFAILVSGNPPPVRPRNRPLAWRGFVWEGIELPERAVRDVFSQIRVMPHQHINFRAASLFEKPKSSGAPALAKTKEPAQPKPAVAVTEPVEQAPAKQPVEPTQSTTSIPAAALAALKPEDSDQTPTSKVNKSPAAVQRINVSEATQVVSAEKTPSAVERTITLPKATDAKANKAQTNEAKTLGTPVVVARSASVARASSAKRRKKTDPKLKRVTHINDLLRRRVAYLEALLTGAELGRGIELDASVGSLVPLILQGARRPQRNIYLRIDVGRGAKIGRVVSVTRYPLYSIGSQNRGSHNVLMDLEVRGPDGVPILKSSAPSSSISVAPKSGGGAFVQFKTIDQTTTLRELGVTEAVWWPVGAP